MSNFLVFKVKIKGSSNYQDRAINMDHVVELIEEQLAPLGRPHTHLFVGNDELLATVDCSLDRILERLA